MGGWGGLRLRDEGGKGSDKEMTLEFPAREHYLMSCTPPRLIVLQLCNSNIGELLYSQTSLTPPFGRCLVFD